MLILLQNFSRLLLFERKFFDLLKFREEGIALSYSCDDAMAIALRLLAAVVRASIPIDL